jgi:glycerol-3-phosphate dehydrogenase subunit C
MIPGLMIVESKADCCGVAGTYGYKREKYEIAMRVGAPLFEFLRHFDAPLVICDSETCRWQITHATGIPAIHPVELVSLACGFPPEGELQRIHILMTASNRS